MKEMEQLRKNVRFERERQELSRIELAKRADLSQFTIIDVELGRASDDIKLSTLLKIAKGLNVTVHDLLKGISLT
ncbi:helix-turn-helix domain-containing protein [Candidatus Dojkabacteria bacterium]|nr:helix-turn-helix domain-containing protein [Candidatus Dojkabacteria bacterium]